MTASHLIAALGKLLLYDLDSFFRTDRVFSACAVSKTDLFARLVNAHLHEHGHTRYVRSMICASRWPLWLLWLRGGSAAQLSLRALASLSKLGLGQVCKASP